MADSSDEDEDYGEPAAGGAFRLHDLAEAGDVAGLRALLPPAAGDQQDEPREDEPREDEPGKDGARAPSAEAEAAPRWRVLAAESSLLEKDEAGCLPVHVAALHARAACVRLLLRRSEALASAMLRLPCGDLRTPFAHLVLRVGAVDRAFCDEVIADLFGAAGGTGAAFSRAFRALLRERLAARDDEGNSVFHLCAANDLADSFRVLAAFFLRERPRADADRDADGAADGAAGVDGAADGAAELRALLDRPNKVGLRPLHLAMKFGSPAVAAALVDEHAVDVNARAALRQTPAHVAAGEGFHAGAALLARCGRADLALADLWGRTPAQVAAACKFPALAALLDGSEPPEAAPEAAPAHQTRFVFHAEALRHLPAARVRRGGPELPAENPERVATLVDERVGILRSREFRAPRVAWDAAVERADVADVLRVHEFHYVDKLRRRCAELRAGAAGATFAWDADTALSPESCDAAFRAAGAVCRAVDAVVDGASTNAFCVVRPPGHHAGPVGKVPSANDPEGSLGFCLLNNVAVGAAYARAHYKRRGIHRVAILDMDVHHGNGTEEIVRQLTPGTRSVAFETPYGAGAQLVHAYKPWRDARDAENVLFCSVHGYGRKEEAGEPLDAWFYPGSGESSAAGSAAPLIVNVGLGVNHEGGAASTSVSRLKWRAALRDRVLPRLRAFDPDLIFLSAGFDAHKKERVNWGYVSLLEQDFEWLVRHLKRVANACCDGRLVSVLEGGYNFHARIASPLARSVAAHARALASPARDEWNERDVAVEAAHERTLLQSYLGRAGGSGGALLPVVKKRRPATAAAAAAAGGAGTPPPPARERSKRARKAVDYVALAKELAAEGRAAAED